MFFISLVTVFKRIRTSFGFIAVCFMLGAFCASDAQAAALSGYSFLQSNPSPSGTSIHTYSYTTVGSVPEVGAILYVMYNSSFLLPASGSDVTVTVNGGAPEAIDTYFQPVSHVAFISLSRDIPGGSNVVVTIQNVTNPGSAGSYSYSFVRTATGGGTEIDAPSSLAAIVIESPDVTAPTVPGIPSATSPTSDTTPTVTWTVSTDAGIGLAALPYTVQWSTSPVFAGTVYTSTTASNTFSDLTALADGAWYYRVSATDGIGNTSAYATSSAIIVDATAPVITLTGESSVSLERGTSYVDAGATALDAVQGVLTSDIVVTNTVNTSVEGSYTVTYAVTDAAGNVGQPVVRTVRVVFINHGGGGGSPSVQPAALQGTSNGGQTPLLLTVNGSALPSTQTTESIVQLGFNADPVRVKGYAASLRADFQGASIYPYQSTIDYRLPDQTGTYVVYVKLYSVTGDPSPVLMRTVEYAQAQPVEVRAAQPTVVPTIAKYQFKRSLRLGMEGDDVRELQKFLNAQGFLVAKRGNGSVGKESTYFGTATVRALARFQEKYRAQVLAPLALKAGTGNFLDVTRLFVNAREF